MGTGQSTDTNGQDAATARSGNQKTRTSGSELADRLHRSRSARFSHVLRRDTVTTLDDDGSVVAEDDRDAAESSPSTDGPCGPSRAVREAASQVDPMDYKFSFENLVLEGGGSKSVAYVGAVKYLEEQGLMSGIQRFGGCSAGAINAGMLACGYTSQEMEQALYSQRIDELLLDARFGILSLLPNLATSYGWHPGCRFYQYYGELVKAKTGDADFTFQQLYRKTGRELCVVVTNLTQKSIQYCHPKTTPYMPIRLAVRMSTSIPVLYSALRYSSTATDEVQDMMVDGGMLCNYPVHCFDGWFLSLKPEDTFLKRLQPLQDISRLKRQSFSPPSDNTLGMLLFSEEERDVLRYGLERRYVCRQPAEPTQKTKLFTAWQRERERKLKAEKEHDKIAKAIGAFLAVIGKYNVHHKDVFNIKELEAAFQDKTAFPEEYAEVLFGKDFTVEEVFALLDYDSSGKIQFDELVRFMENNGVDVQTSFLTPRRHSIDSFSSFLWALQNTLIENLYKAHLQESDFERSIGINTGYMETADFNMEPADIEFLTQRGYNSAKAFLQYFVAAHPDKVQKMTL